MLVTFSLNPKVVADLWEGKLDDGTRVTPPVEARLAASLRAQEMGFEVRWRVDPIMPVEAWRDVYAEFFNQAASNGHGPSRITLGTYRQTQSSLQTFITRWGLPPMEWKPPGLEKDGMHYHMSVEHRVEIYTFMAAAICDAWRDHGGAPIVALCKEPRCVRKEVGLDHDMCNCG